ncbi:MAG: sugar phosphate isomerase/epimerase [Clostridiales bacterium]|nr:sugar phosphate isomerase/epimerase [Clostridiales bacterium]
MKILSYELPLGLSVAHSPEAMQGFIDAGFTHFEIGIPACLPDAVRLDGMDSRDPETVRLGALRAERGREEKLAERQEARLAKLYENHLRPWSVHLPFGPGWDIAHVLSGERAEVCASLKRLIDITSAWKPKVYVLHGCLEPVKPEDRALRIARSILSLRELDAHAARCGARIALENLPRSCLANSSEETLAMSEAAGNVPIVFDVNHLLGESHASFLDALADRVISTHLSDYDGIDERHRLPGKGIVPWRLVVTRLCEAGYRGPLLFELRTGENGPYDAKTVLKAFESALSREQ